MDKKLIITQRELDEIALARIYANRFHHGTDGHNRLILIAKLSKFAGIEVDEGGNVTYSDSVDVVEDLRR
jgi:hypothetical protein